MFLGTCINLYIFFLTKLILFLPQVKNSAETIENMVERERSPTQRLTIKLKSPGNNNLVGGQSKCHPVVKSPTLSLGSHQKMYLGVPLSNDSKSSSQPSINIDDEPEIKTLKPHQTLSSTVSCPPQTTKTKDTWI